MSLWRFINQPSLDDLLQINPSKLKSNESNDGSNATPIERAKEDNVDRHDMFLF